jgi:uncharacterized protein YkwD
MRVARPLLLLLVAALLLCGATAPAQAEAAKRKPSACASAKAKAKKKPTAARKRAVRRACRKRAPRRPAAAAPTAPASPAPAPATSAPTPTSPAPAAATTPLQDGVVACANRERAARGLAPLKVDPVLTRAADGHAADMAARGFFDHVTPEGRTPWDRIEAALAGALPFGAMGENIAMGYGDAEAACEGWMDSPGHRANILEPRFTLIGAGWVDGYAVQNFGDR